MTALAAGDGDEDEIDFDYDEELEVDDSDYGLDDFDDGATYASPDNPDNNYDSDGPDEGFTPIPQVTSSDDSNIIPAEDNSEDVDKEVEGDIAEDVEDILTDESEEDEGLTDDSNESNRYITESNTKESYKVIKLGGARLYKDPNSASEYYDTLIPFGTEIIVDKTVYEPDTIEENVGVEYIWGHTEYKGMSGWVCTTGWANPKMENVVFSDDFNWFVMRQVLIIASVAAVILIAVIVIIVVKKKKSKTTIENDDVSGISGDT